MQQQTPNQNSKTTFYDPEFDPDAGFDWDLIEPAPCFQDAVDLLARTLCKSRYMRDSEVDKDPGKPVYKMTLGPLDESGIAYVTGEAFHRTIVPEPKTPHGHPISHALTDINEELVIRKLESTKFLDVFGNPGRNSQLKSNAKVLMGSFSPRDALRNRHARNFKNVEAFDMDWLVKQSDYQEMLFTHSLYYLSVDEIAKILNYDTGNRVIHAIVHRHPAASGWLNNGEIRYTVGQDGMVTQYEDGVKGEGYTHKNMEPFFHQTDCTTNYGNIAWTVTKLCGDSYHLEFIGYIGKSAGPLMPMKVKEEVHKVSETDTIVVRRWCGCTWLSYKIGKTRYTLENSEFYEILCKYISGKERSPRYRQDLFNHARRLTDPKDIFATHGGKWFDVPADLVPKYVIAAFYHGVQDELDVVTKFEKTFGDDLKALNLYYTTGKLPTDWAVPIRTAIEAVTTISKAAVWSLSTLGDGMDYVPFGKIVKFIVTAPVLAGEAMYDDIRAAAELRATLVSQAEARMAKSGFVKAGGPHILLASHAPKVKSKPLQKVEKVAAKAKT